jgi:hypothetical protein
LISRLVDGEGVVKEVLVGTEAVVDPKPMAEAKGVKGAVVEISVQEDASEDEGRTMEQVEAMVNMVDKG